MDIKKLGRVAIYYRVSTDKQDLISQEHTVTEWLKDKSCDSVTVFRDEGVSGSRDDRPAFLSMLSACESAQIDTIVVYRLDRFSRDASTAIRLILGLDAGGTAFISVTQPVLNLGHDNPFRRTMLAAFAEISEIERDTIITRIKSGLDAARRRGVSLGRPRSIPEVTRLKVQEMKSQGKSYRSIADRLDISLGAVQKIIKTA